MLKKVLVIDYFFPPLLWGWAAAAFAKFLPNFNWHPIFICADENVSYSKDYSLLKYVPDNTRVHRIAHQEILSRWQRLRNRLKIGTDFPDSYKAWIKPAHYKAREIIQKEKIDLIYSVSPPFSIAFVSMRLKHEFGIPLVIFVEDGWAASEFFMRNYEQRLIRPLCWLHKHRVMKAEREILEVADKILAISDYAKQNICALHGINSAKVEVFTDCYDESAFTEAVPLVLYPDKLVLTFLGTFYEPYIETTKRFLKVVNRIQKDAEIIIVGNAAWKVHQMNLPNLNCILPLPREKAHGLGLGSSFLFLCISSSSGNWVPTKLYTYLRLGKPIIALVPEDGAIARIIREAKAGYIISYDEEKMKQQLTTIFDEWRKGKLNNFQPNWAYVNQFERKKSVEKIAHIFDRVAS